MDEYIRLDTTIIGIDNLISKASTAEEANALFKAKDVIYSQQRCLTDVQPVKHGRWIIDYAEGTKIYHAHCSECGERPDRHIGGDYYIDKLSDFCPNCGARMDGDSE